MSDRKNNYINTDVDRIVNLINEEIKKYPENYLGINSLKYLVTNLLDLKSKESLFDSETGEIKPSDYQTYHECCDNVRNAFNDIINLGQNQSKEENFFLDPNIREFLQKIGSEYNNFLPLISDYFPEKMKEDIWKLDNKQKSDKNNLLAQWAKEIDDGNLPKYPSSRQSEYPSNIPEKLKVIGNLDDLASYYVKNKDSLQDSQREFIKNRAQAIYYFQKISKDSKKYKHSSILTPVVSNKNPNDVQLTGFEGLYEQQTTYNGCWSCNYSMLLKSRGVPITQHMIRSFRPNISLLEANTIASKTVEGLAYDLPYNPIELADVTNTFIPNAAIRQISCGRISIGEKKTQADMEIVQRKREKLKDLSRNAIVQALKKGNPVGLREGNHFLTIVGIEGDTLKVLNSLGDKQTGYLETCSLTDKVKNGEICLTWIEDVSPESILNLNEDIMYAENNLVEGNGSNEGINRTGRLFYVPVSEEEGPNKLDVQDTIYVPQTLSNSNELLDNPENTLDNIKAFSLENDKANFKPIYEEEFPILQNETEGLKKTTTPIFTKSVTDEVLSNPTIPIDLDFTMDMDTNAMAEITYDGIRKENIRQLRGILAKLKDPSLNNNEIENQSRLLWDKVAKIVADENIIAICKSAGFTNAIDIQNLMLTSEPGMIDDYIKSEAFKNAVNNNLQSINKLDSLDYNTAFDQMSVITYSILDSMSTGTTKTKTVKNPEVKTEIPDIETLKPEDVERRKLEDSNLSEIDRIREENLYNLRNTIYKANHAKELGDNALVDPEGAIKYAFAKLITDETILKSCKALNLDENTTLDHLKSADKDAMFNEISKSKLLNTTYTAQNNIIKELESDSFENAKGMATVLAENFYDSFRRNKQKELKEKEAKLSSFNADIFSSELNIIAKQIKKIKTSTNNTKALSECIVDLKNQFGGKNTITINDADKESMLKKLNEASKLIKAFRWDGKSPLSKNAQQELKIMRRIENTIKLSSHFIDPKTQIQRSYTASEMEQYKIAEKLLSCKANKLMESKNPSDIRKGIAMLLNNKVHDEAHKAIMQDEAFKTMTSPDGKSTSELSDLLKTDNAEFMKEYERVQGIISPNKEIVPPTNVL